MLKRRRPAGRASPPGSKGSRATGTTIGDTVKQETRRIVTTHLAIAFALLAFVALPMSLVLSPQLAHADTMGFDARPLPGSPNAELGFFKFDADAGATVQRVLVLTNHADKAKVIRVAACDGLAAVFGGVAYSDSGKKPQAVGSWIQLPRTSVEVPAGSSVSVPFEVKVPADVTTGVHVGGLAVWEPAAATTSGSGEGGGDKASTKITMVTRMVLTVYVTTPGPAVPELTISGVKAEARPDGMYLLVAVANDGTGPTSGEGTLAVPSENFQQPIALGDMVPTASTGYPVKWKTDPAQGTYQAEAQIRYAGGTKVANWSGSFIVGDAEMKTLEDRLVGGTTGGLPWELIGWVILSMLGAVIFLLSGILLGRLQQCSA